MPQYLDLPDGSGIQLREGESADQAWSRAQQMYPDAFGIKEKKKETPKQKSKEGFKPAFEAATEEFKGGLGALAGKLGIVSPEEGEAYYKAQKAKAQQIHQPTEKSFLEDPVTNFKELLGGSLPSMIGPAVAGIGAGLAAPGLAVAGLGAGTLAALGVGTGQFTASNFARKLDEGEKLKEASLGESFAAAPFQAALDTFGLRMIPGVKKIFGDAAIKISNAEAKKIATQGLTKTLGDYAATGVKVSGAEGLTEAGQQVLERLQAGLSITDSEARKEYFDNFLGGAVLGGTLSVPGRFFERGAAKSQAAAADREEQAAKLAQQQTLDEQEKQKQEAFKQSDEYITDLTGRWTAFDTQYKDLLAKKKAKVANDDLVGQANKKEAQTALSELLKDPANQELINEYRAVKSKVDAEKAAVEQARVEAEKKAAYEQAMQKPGAQGELFGGTADQDLIEASRAQQQQQQEQQQKAGAVPAPMSSKKFNEEQAGLSTKIQNITQLASEATDEDKIDQYSKEHDALEEEQRTLDAQRAQIQQAEPGAVLYSPQDLKPENIDIDLANARKKLAKAKEVGDMAAIKKANTQIQDLKSREGLFNATNVGRADTQQFYDLLVSSGIADQIADGKKQAQQERENIENEIARLRKISEANKEPSVFGNSVAKKEAEDARKIMAMFAPKTHKTQTGKIILLPPPEQDWNRLKTDPKNVEYQQDRETLKETLEKEIREHRKESKKDEVLPSIHSFLINEKEKQLADVNRRIEIGQKTSTIAREEEGPSNAQLQDQRISDLIDQLLPRALGSEKTKTTKLISPADVVEQRKKRQEKVAAFKERLAELKRILPAMHAEVIKGAEAAKHIQVKPQTPAYNAALDGDVKDAQNEIQTLKEEKLNKLEPSLAKLKEEMRSIIKRAGKENDTAYVNERMNSPEIQDLNGRIAAIDRRISRLTDLLQPLIISPDLIKATKVTKPLNEQYQDLVDEYKYLMGRVEQLESIGVAGAVEGPGRNLPIVEADTQLRRIRENNDILAELKDKIKKAGKPTDPQKVKALEELRTQRTFVEDEIKNAETTYKRLQEREQQAPAEKERTQGDLFALSSAYGKSSEDVRSIQNTLDRLYKERDDIKADLRRRGQEASTPQLQALLDAFAKRPTGRYQQIVKEIERSEQEFLNATGKASEKYQAFADEREAERTAPTPQAEQKLLPGFGLKQYTTLKNPVPKAVMDEARTKQVNLQTQLEKVRAAAGKTSKEETDLINELARLRKSKVSKGDIVGTNVTYAKQVEENLAKRIEDARNAREKNLVKQEEKLREQIEKAKVKVQELESKQRMYEEQQDVINKAPPGQRAAERLLAGEGYRVIAGKQAGKVRTKPTKLASWGLKKLAKTEAVKPDVLGKATAKMSAANKVVQMAVKEREGVQQPYLLEMGKAKERLVKLNDAVNSLSKESENILADNKALDTLKEIEQLQDFLDKYGTRAEVDSVNYIFDRFDEEMTPARTVQLYSQMLANVTNMSNQVVPLEKKLNEIKQRFDKLQSEGYYIGPALEEKTEELIKEATPVDKAHTRASVKYAIARRDLLAFQYRASEKVRAAYREAVKARDIELNAQLNNPEFKDAAEAIKQAQSIQAEAEKRADEARAEVQKQIDKLNAERRAKEKAQDDLLKQAKAERGGVPSEVAQRGREGLGLEGTRVELDTSGPLAQAVQNNAKKMLGMAQTQLKDAIDRDDTEAVKQHTLEVKRYERELEQVLPVAERKVTEITNEITPAEQEEVEPGERMPNRREGPVVRTASRAPNAFLSGTAESRTPIGARNRPTQAGTIKLRAADLDPEKANAISLHVTREKLDATKAGTKRKETLQKQYDRAIKGLTPEQVEQRLAEGKELMKEGGDIEVIAARERWRESEAVLARAEEARRAAKTSAMKEITQDDLDVAKEKADILEARYKDVKAKAFAKKNNARVDEVVEEDIELTDKASKYNRLNKAIDDADDEFFAAAAREAPGTVLPDNAIKALLDGSLINALEQIKIDTKGFLSEHADAVRQFLVRTKVEIVPEIIYKGKSVPALYDPGTNTVYFTPQGFTVEDVVHEATHAATMRVLTMPEKDLTPVQLAARRELEAMYKTLNRDSKFSKQYGMENIKEFVSEVLSNKDLRALMDKKPWFKGNMVVQFFKRLFDLFRTNKLGEAMVPKAEALIKDIFLPSRIIENVEAVGAAPTYKSALIGSSPNKMETFRGNFLGLGGRVQFVDRLGAADAAIVAGEGAAKLTSAEAFNTQYFMRMGDQVSTAAGQFILHGPVKIVHEIINGVKEFRYQSQKGATLVGVTEHLGKLAKSLTVSDTEAERMATVLIAGERANAISGGWQRLAGDRAAEVKAEYDADIRTLRANPQAKAFFDALRKEYKAYNDGQLDFAVDTDFMSKAEAERLKRLPYIPFYRIQNGVVQLITADEKPRTIGNIKDNPDLKQMVGDDGHILPLLTSAVQNTFMLTRMSLGNKATLETANALNKSGFVSRIGKGAGLANKDTVHYKVNGEDAFATIDADTFGIPAHLIVSGMEGIKTTIPAIVQLMGVPAQWIRKFVTRMPAYGVRQLLRDPVNSFMLSGVDGLPMVNALKELAKMQTGTSQAEQDLMQGLAVSSNVFSGNEQDMTKFLQDIQSGKSGWQTFMGKLDRFALQADTATRATVYNDSLNKGMSKARAQFRAFESQNLSRRGLSPSMQMANTLIPFFNSQIQGLDFLYRSLKGNMPFAEQLEIRRKIVARSMMLMATSIGYAMMMEDDEDYRKASPEERYSNFFVHIPFVKEALKIPIPYEIGILFKALPEALIDSMHKDMTAYETFRGLGKVMLAAVPGVNPGATKPLIEAYYGQTSVGPIESDREKRIKATERYRPDTTEVAKLAGKATGLIGISPLMLEHLARGYTGSLGLAALHMVDPILASGEEGEKPSTPMNKMPFIGGLFQNPEGHYIIQRGYERMNDIEEAKATYKDKIAQGKRAEAEEFRQRYAELISAAPAAGQYKQFMGKMFERARRVAADPNLTREEKDRQLEEIRNSENKYASTFVSRVNERIPQ